MNKSEYILKVEKVNKKYERFALKEVSFSVKRGEITGFIGNNGAGKTTVLKCILGVVPYSSGRITIDGFSILEKDKEYKEKIGVVFDDGCYYDNLSLKDMKNVIARAYLEWNEKLYCKYINKFHLQENQKIGTLSKGMKMKYSLALALSHNAELLIFDEPSSGLDPKTRDMLCLELLEQKNNGKTIFFSTHITSDLDKIGDNIVLINDGIIIENCTKKQFLESSLNKHLLIEDAMLERVSGRKKNENLIFNKKGYQDS